MRTSLIYGPGDIRVEEVADPVITSGGDAIVRVVATCVCGSDLHPYRGRKATDHGDATGHEFVGVVEQVGSSVSSVKPGDFVVSPFAYSCGTCTFCLEGLHTSCRTGGFYGAGGGAQAELVRVPHADGTLVGLPVDSDTPLLADLLAMADVFPTGHHCAVTAGVSRGTSVAVIGDGAVGLCAVLAARRLGAERIILLGRHEDRTAIGRGFGATDVVAARGEDAVSQVRELTGGDGVHAVLECVGSLDALQSALAMARPGGTVSRVGVPQYHEAPGSGQMFRHNVTLTGGVAPVRAYLDELLPEVLDGRLRPGRVFDRTMPLADIADAYRAMDQREALKVMITP